MSQPIGYFLCGAGGSGMSALAQILLQRGHTVRGSDRSYDRGDNPETYAALKSAGMEMVPQDGSGVTGSEVLVVSSAVEETIPDVRAALDKGIPIHKRAEILAGLFNASRGVAVGGTSGKTTVTGMVGQILKASGRDPTVVNGGIMLNEIAPGRFGNAVSGEGEEMVIEADESDGTISLYRPAVSVLTNISMDHKPLPELRKLFSDFCSLARERCVANADCPESRAAAGEGALTFGIDDASAELRASEIRPTSTSVEFAVRGVPFRLRVPGRHNVSNALAATGAALACEVTVEEAADGLAEFQGIRRRLETLGEANGVLVIDDFAHNPDKIQSSLATLKEGPGRILAMFQPTGFAPTRFLKDGLIAAFREGLDGEDMLFMPAIYYAGGTAARDISSRDLIDPIRQSGIRAEYIEERSAVGDRLVEAARPGDRIVVMGARDDTLTTFAKNLLDRLREERHR